MISGSRLDDRPLSKIEEKRSVSHMKVIRLHTDYPITSGNNTF